MNRLLSFSLLVVCLIGLAQAEIFQAGTTYSPAQQNGSCGRVIEVDRQGRAHVAWTKTMTGATSSARHVYYNLWDPADGQWRFVQNTLPTGTSVSNDSRSANVSLTMGADGWCFPAYHSSRGLDDTHAAVAMDYEPGMGAFAASSPGYYMDNGTAIHTGWSKIAADAAGNLHMVSAEYETIGDRAKRLFYSRAAIALDSTGQGMAPQWQNVGGQQLQLFDSSKVLAHDIACAPHLPRVARAWIRPPIGYMPDSLVFIRDVFVQISEDAGLTWGTPLNITHFVQPVVHCEDPLQNGVCCNRDTVSAYRDLSLLFDHNDRLHLAFTTVGYRYMTQGAITWAGLYPNKASIWHWCEDLPTIDRIASEWIADEDYTWTCLAALHALLERPSLSVDSLSGRIYCSYIRYDTSATSSAGYCNADIYVAYSETNGAWWWRGMNVTNTCPIGHPGNGQNLSEQDPSLAPWISNDQLHLFYLLDLDANPLAPQYEEGSLQPMLYRQVPVGGFTREYQNAVALRHIESSPCELAEDRTGFNLVPSSLRLSAYPNPFNAMTMIRYELPSSGPIQLGIFDVLGRNVETLYSGFQTAGSHDIQLDGSALVTGVYFVRLTAGQRQTEQKILLLK
jgi:hypothetical protein